MNALNYLQSASQTGFSLSAIIGTLCVWPIKSIRRLFYQIQLVYPRNRWRQFKMHSSKKKRLGNTQSEIVMKLSEIYVQRAGKCF